MESFPTSIHAACTRLVNLIIKASMVYKGNGWLSYDCWFRQASAANPDIHWFKTDTDLWDLAFTGLVKKAKSVHRLSLSHKWLQCNGNPDITDMSLSTKYSSHFTLKVTPYLSAWNRYPYMQPVCSQFAGSSISALSASGIP